MAIREYNKNGKTLFSVYVQSRGKELKRVRLQKVTSGHVSLVAAKKEEKRLIKELAEKVLKLEGKGLLWSEIIYRWEVALRNDLLNTRVNRATVLDHVKRLERYSRPWFKKNASELTRADGRQLLNFIVASGGSKALMMRIKGSINLVYNFGVEEGLIQLKGGIPKSPVYGLDTGPKVESMKPILTLEEVRKLLFEAKVRSHPWYPIWAFALLTGMRSGELMALTWGDIDDQNGIIRVSKSFNKALKITKCPKNGTWRNVDISPQLQELIREIRVERAQESTVLPILPEWRNGFASVVLRSFMERIGINKPAVFHTLRACFATHLLSLGVEQAKVMRMGGWSDLKTFQIYLRLAGVDVRGVTSALDILPALGTTENVFALR
jgi:integrase